MLENQKNTSMQNQIEVNKVASMSKEERMDFILLLAHESMRVHQSLYEKLAK